MTQYMCYKRKFIQEIMEMTERTSVKYVDYFTTIFLIFLQVSIYKLTPLYYIMIVYEVNDI